MSNGHSIVAKEINNRLYVPSFMSEEVCNIISKEGYVREADIVCDIPESFHKLIASTSSRIFREFCSNTRNRYFISVDTKKGYGYIGTKGVILDQEYKPIVIFCNVYDIIDGNIRYYGPECLVSPRVFTNTDLISKFVVKNLIPNIHNAIIYSTPKVLISNTIDEFVNNPKAPKGTDFNEQIYSMLENYINEIVDEPQGILQGLDQSDRFSGVQESDSVAGYTESQSYMSFS